MVKFYQAFIALVSSLLACPVNANQTGVDDLELVSCVLTPSQTVDLAPAVSGVITELYVERGSKVKRGDKVVSLARGIEVSAVELARARLLFAERSIERSESLAAIDLLSEQEKDEMETERYLAALELKRARQILAEKTVLSPINGVVVNVPVSVGEVVGVGDDSISTLVSLDPLKVEMVFETQYYGRLSLGESLNIRLPRNDRVYSARVDVIDPLIDPASDTFGVRLNLPNPDQSVPAGLRCALVN